MNKNIIIHCPECGNDKLSKDDNFCTTCGCDLQPYKTTLG